LPLLEIWKWNYEPNGGQDANHRFGKSTCASRIRQTHQALSLKKLKNFPHPGGLRQNQIFEFRAEAFVEIPHLELYVIRCLSIVFHCAVEVIPKRQCNE